MELQHLFDMELRYQTVTSFLEEDVSRSPMELVHYLIQQYANHFPTGDRILHILEQGLSLKVKSKIQNKENVRPSNCHVITVRDD